MSKSSFTTSFTVDQTPQTAFAAINDVRGWWSQDIEGKTDMAGEAFDYHYRDSHRCRIQVTELVPGKKVVWHVLDNYFSFIDDKTEWIGTDIIFDISRKSGETEVRFTHQGLVPDYECYDACSDGWSTFVNGSLRSLIASGKGTPLSRDS